MILKSKVFELKEIFLALEKAKANFISGSFNKIKKQRQIDSSG